jgi:AcrR family transcriptional regulator
MAVSNEAKGRNALESATSVFSRYGYARTTMGDIASAAGISRPALYLLFPDKQSIFDAAIHHMDEQKHAGIRAGLDKMENLRSKLLYACQSWGSHGVDLSESHPDAADLFDLRHPAVRRVYTRFENLIADLIEARVAASGIGASSAELARALVFGMRGLRDTATNGEEMRRLIAVQVETLFRAIA